ncbi:hypothetical protein [Pseudonocardia sp.]|uniref:hypothetical protein n=1 Tax=Pseudonocardia sp. TaxID=60912 RepID=UPI0026265BA6|nr:hypothetical protein [Pseudonocardia sp.]
MLPVRGGTTGVTGEIRVETDTGTTSVAVLITGNLTIKNTGSTVILINTEQLRIDIAAVLAQSPDAIDIVSRPRHVTASAIVSAGLAVQGVVAITGSAPPATVLLIVAATAWPVRRALVDPVKCGPEPNRAGLEQCGPAGVRRWLHNGARAAGDPGRFLTAYRPAGDPRRTCADAPA